MSIIYQDNETPLSRVSNVDTVEFHDDYAIAYRATDSGTMVEAFRVKVEEVIRIEG